MKGSNIWQVRRLGVEFQIQEDLVKMLDYAAEKYKLGDKHKALRCILDYVATDADWDEMFQSVRCNRCGPDGGWSQEEHEK